jgi:hypothetical protein
MCHIKASTREWIDQHRYRGTVTFGIVVSTGHSGTTFLGNLDAWKSTYGSDILTRLRLLQETEFGGAEALLQIPLSKDYCDQALKYVAEFRLQEMEKSASALKGNAEGKIVLQVGHETMLGILPALWLIFGDKVKFIRLRRDRLDTAFSCTVHHGGAVRLHTRASFSVNDANIKHHLDGPCTQRVWALCPFDASVQLLPRGDTWHRLSSFQRNLWFIDEMEAQWVALRRSFPDIPYTEVNWRDKITTDTFSHIGSYLGLGPAKGELFVVRTAEQSNNNSHLSDASNNFKDRKLLQSIADDYAKLLKLPDGACNAFDCVPDA